MAEPLTDTGPLGNKRAEDASRKQARTRAGKLREALRWILGDERGRFYLAELVRESKALERERGITVDQVMFTDGKKSMGFKVLNDVRALEEPKFVTALIVDALNLHGEKDNAGPDTESDTDA